jgi:acyl carrier protein
MDKNELFEIINILKPENKYDTNEDIRLREDLGLNSIQMIKLVMKVEQKFDINLNAEDMKSFTSILELTKLINRKLSK